MFSGCRWTQQGPRSNDCNVKKRARALSHTRPRPDLPISEKTSNVNCFMFTLEVCFFTVFLMNAVTKSNIGVPEFSGTYAAKEVAKEVAKESAKEAAKEVAKEAGEEVAKEAGEESSKEAAKESAEEASLLD